MFLANYRIIIDEVIRFEVIHADVVDEKADVLVNTSNQHLNHDGGLAKAYNMKSGQNDEKEYNL